MELYNLLLNYISYILGVRTFTPWAFTLRQIPPGQLPPGLIPTNLLPPGQLPPVDIYPPWTFTPRGHLPPMDKYPPPFTPRTFTPHGQNPLCIELERLVINRRNMQKSL